MKKVLGIGEIVFDIVNLVSEHPAEGAKINSASTEYSLGGSVPCALILLSRLGASCLFIGSVGKDEFANKISKGLKAEKISFMPVWQKTTKVHTVMVNSQNASRTIIKNNAQQDLIKKIPIKVIKSADLIIIDRHEPLVLDQIVAYKKQTARIVIDPSTEISAKTLKMIRLADFPILPIESLPKISKQGSLFVRLRELYKIAEKPVIVTAGEKGCLVFDGGKIDFFPAYKINAVDTLGAGDIFRGAFGFGVLNGWHIKKCACFANKVAALQCSKLGNGAAIPFQKEIEDFEKVAVVRDTRIEELL